MCGICGVVDFNSAGKSNAGVVRAMARQLAHRGPDDEGFASLPHADLGHRRLSIIDLEGGRQPMTNEDGSIVVVFNGEIYNFQELACGLEGCGHRFRTRCDTEVIVHGYEEQGERYIEHLRGMFAIALWDRRRESLLLCRDRLGIKPLYFFHDGGRLAFASELKALLELPGMAREIDPEALELYLSLRYVPGPLTMLKGIFKLEPGHLGVFDRAGWRMRPYWDLASFAPQDAMADAAHERFAAVLDDSVRLRLISDVPLGVFLSGGLDSSAILSVMSRLADGTPVQSFAVGYEAATAEEDEANELGFARLAAKAFASDHHELRVLPRQLSSFLPTLVWYMDEPLADPTCIPLFLMSQLARKDVTVVLSGEGADEILAGYSIYRRMLFLDHLYPWASFVPAGLVGLLPGEAFRAYGRLVQSPLARRYRGVSRGLRPELCNRLLGRGGRGGAASGVVDAVFDRHFRAVEGRTPLDQMLYVDLKVWLPDDLLLKADRMTMANAQELRVPFLDHKLVELAATLPPHLKLGKHQGKLLLREVMATVLPQQILTRPKKGFPVPTAPWLREPLKELTQDLLLGPGAACSAHVDTGVVRQLVGEHQRGERDRSQELWTLLIFELWHRVFVDRRLAPESDGVGCLAGAARRAAMSAAATVGAVP
ncbi:MAG: asparagine synthase (glutamine-hydrolyzing) [Candidatus Schekmanbacteria bacterium]|nr:asparagine synthase (glutamine-hydrolyzing) [Candidatus Schekmanbacteria bacterium]